MRPALLPLAPLPPARGALALLALALLALAWLTPGPGRGARAAPPAPALGPWEAALGLPLAGRGEARAEGAGLVLLGPGESLLLRPVDPAATDAAALEAALDEQLAPFRGAGLKPGAAEGAACAVAGQPGRCLSARVEVGPGAALAVRAGRRPGAPWVAVCLDRRPQEAGPCAGLLDP
jgi:hypothetical protein